MEKMAKTESEEFTEWFDKFPMKCKEMFFKRLFWLSKHGNSDVETLILTTELLDKAESPIELILQYALLLTMYLYPGYYGAPLVLLFNEPIDGLSKNYRADIFFDCDEQPYGEFDGYKLVIECDGHEFHEKTKEQVEYRNERDLELKKHGIDVLHFSGSQIYNNPFKCAFQIIELIVSKDRSGEYETD